MPGARSVSQFRETAYRGVSQLRQLTRPPWDWKAYLARRGTADHSHTAIAAEVADYEFDWRRFRMPPVEAEAINAMQLMVLDAGTQALDQANIIPRSTTGLFLGATGLGWQRDHGLRIHLPRFLTELGNAPSFRILPDELQDEIRRSLQRRLDGQLRPVSEDTVVNAAASVALGRIAMHHNLAGLHYGVDAGFASSLAALEAGVDALRDGTLDMALVGGASELLNPLELVAFSGLGGLSESLPTPFSVEADGTLLGEGTVMFALKRLGDALRDGEDILAVVRGVAGSTDAPGRAMVAPSAEGQLAAISSAWRNAGVEAHELDYVETHGTGTRRGDATELQALARAFHGRDPNSVALGAVKESIGHLRGAAGAVGLLRAIIAVQEGWAPSLHHGHDLLPELADPASPLCAAAPRSHRVARAGVSSFGFGGVNYHAVVEAFDPAVHTADRQPPAPTPTSSPIAIVGMGGRFPQARDLEAFATLLDQGTDTTERIPASRWSLERHFDPDRQRNETSYSDLGCFVDLPPAPPSEAKIPPSSVPSLDPSHILALESAETAMADAGLELDRLPPDRVGTYLAFLPYQGKKFDADIRVNYLEYDLALSACLEELGVEHERAERIRREAEREFKAELPPVDEDTMTGYLGSLNAARVMRRFGFTGPHAVYDSACASTHSALHAAVTALRLGRCDVALSGGVWCDMRPEFYVAACRFNALSPSGITPFDAAADGFVPGEGAGVFVLKRLDDAVADGDRIHAVLRNVDGSSDTSGRSVLAPSVEGEALAMERTLERAEIDPSTVGYVECHGTGTALGDRVEAQAMARAYGLGEDSPRTLAIGSVKSNIGHLNAAAGVPALIKAVWAVRDGEIPASIKCAERNPDLPTPLDVVTQARTWSERGAPRRAGVSGFGVGGSNMHLVVEQYRESALPISAPVPAPRAARPVLAASGPTVQACLDQMGDLLSVHDRLGRDVALSRAAEIFDPNAAVRLSATLGERAGLENKLLHLEQPEMRQAVGNRGVFLVDTAADPGHTAITFPGQGPQYAHMLAQAAGSVDVIRRALDEADALYQRIAGRPLTPAFWSDDVGGQSQNHEDMHCAVFAVNVALYRLVRSWGLSPRCVVGQSAGEVAALVAAGALTFESGLRTIRARTTSVLDHVAGETGGRMLAIGCSAQRVRPLLMELPGFSAIAADNGPNACIVSAANACVAPLVSRCEAEGLVVNELGVSHGYHSSLIAGAIPHYRAALDSIEFGAFDIPMVSTITGGAHPKTVSPRWLRGVLCQQFVSPVQLLQALEASQDLGARRWLECGPKWALTTFTRECLAVGPLEAMATIHPKPGEVEQIDRAYAWLCVHGEIPYGIHHSQNADPTPIQVDTPPLRSAEPQPPQGRLEDLLRALHQTLTQHFSPPTPQSHPNTQPQPQPKAKPQPKPEAHPQPQPQPQPKPKPEAQPKPQPQPQPQPQPDFEARIAQAIASATGYPLDMLEVDLDLEADLGIDTVKQVAIFSRFREGLDLEPDPDAKPREWSTIRKAAAHFRKRLEEHIGEPVGPASHDSPPERAPAEPVEPVAPAKPRPRRPDLDVRALILAQVVARTGYPPTMIEDDLDFEADLGIDTVKQAQVLTSVRDLLSLQQDPDVSVRQLRTLRLAVAHFERRVSAAGSSSDPAHVHAEVAHPDHPQTEPEFRSDASGTETIEELCKGLEVGSALRGIGFEPRLHDAGANHVVRDPAGRLLAIARASTAPRPSSPSRSALRDLERSRARLGPPPDPSHWIPRFGTLIERVDGPCSIAELVSQALRSLHRLLATETAARQRIVRIDLLAVLGRVDAGPLWIGVHRTGRRSGANRSRILCRNDSGEVVLMLDGVDARSDGSAIDSTEGECDPIRGRQ